MIFETFQHMCIAAIGMLESERDTQIDFTNQNGVEFSTRITPFKLKLVMSFDDIVCSETFLTIKDPEKATALDIIDAAIAMADWVEENINIDQYDLIELKNRHHDNS